MKPGEFSETERRDLDHLAMDVAVREGAGPNARMIADSVMARFDDPRPFRDLDHARTWIRVATKQTVLDHTPLPDRGLVPS